MRGSRGHQTQTRQGLQLRHLTFILKHQQSIAGFAARELCVLVNVTGYVGKECEGSQWICSLPGGPCTSPGDGMDQ